MMKFDHALIRALALCLSTSSFSLHATEARADQARLKAISPISDQPGYRLVLNRCMRLSFGVECNLTMTAKDPMLVRYSKYTYLIAKGGGQIPATWISIGGEGQVPPRHIGGYFELENGFSTDIIFRFEGEVPEVQGLVASFGAFGPGRDIFRFAP